MLVEALEKHFGAGVEVLGDPAGMHLMARFADREVGARARRNRVRMIGVSAYYLGAAPEGEYVLGFSSIGERTIREAVRRIAG